MNDGGGRAGGASRLLQGVPRRVRLLLGLACVLLGMVLAVSPFASLAVLVALLAAGLILTGLSEAASSSDAPAPLPRVALGALWLLAGVAVAAWPGLTIGALAVLAGAGLVVSGLVQVLGGIRGTADERIAAVVGGIASVVFGVLALTWPDVTVFVIAVVFGARMVLFGASQVVAALRRGPAAGNSASAVGTDAPPRAGTLRRWSRALVAMLALIAAFGLLTVSIRRERCGAAP